MMNGSPLGMRKKVQLMVILTILAWATQTLFHQWGFGQTVAGAQEKAPQTAERFVPGTARFAAGATLEMRTEATVVGREVKLRQVCRWSGADDAVFAPLADLVLVRIAEDQPFQPVTLDQIRATLHDAGVNLAVVRFAGPTSCTVARSDVEVDEQQALLEWANAKKGTAKVDNGAATDPDGAAAVAATQRVAGPVASVTDSDRKTLRDLLVRDLSMRLHVPVEDLHVTFNPKDDQALRLAEPQFKFDVQPRRVRNLGAVAWDVQILTAGPGNAAARRSQKISITATARAWQRQVVLAKPLSFKQTIRDEDVSERRILVDNLDDDPLLDVKQVVAQQAARELKPGTVMTAKSVQPVPLARAGQFVTVTLSRGAVTVKTVARAMEEGSYGQAIRVKNEGTKDVFEVTLTGPQEATMGPPPPPTAEAAAR